MENTKVDPEIKPIDPTAPAPEPTTEPVPTTNGDTGNGEPPPR